MIPRIICDRCNKEVHRVSCGYYDYSGEYIFIVFCHGLFERQKFPAHMLDDGWEIIEVRAFRQKKTVVFGPGFVMKHVEPAGSSQIIEGEIVEPVKCLTHVEQPVKTFDPDGFDVVNTPPYWSAVIENGDAI